MKNFIKLKDKNGKWVIVDRDVICFGVFDPQEDHFDITIPGVASLYVAYAEENINAIMGDKILSHSACSAPLESNKFKSCLSSSDKYPFSEYAAGHICTDLCTK